MPDVYEHALTVVATDIDGLGHANNLRYLAWMQAAALAHSAAQGWPSDRYAQMAAGFVVRSHEIKYLQSAYIDELLIVRTWVADMKGFSSLRRYRIIRAADQAVLATAATQWAFVDYRTGQLKRIPPEVAEAFEVVAD